MMKESTNKLAVIDLDQTIFFTDNCILKACNMVLGEKLTREEIRKCPREIKSLIYDLACTEFINYAKANRTTIKRINSLKKAGYKIVILTGRNKRVEPDTVAILKKNAVYFDVIYHNPDNSIHDEEFKTKKLSELSLGYDIIEVYEDKIDNIKYIRDKLRPNNFKFYHVRGNKISKL